MRRIAAFLVLMAVAGRLNAQAVTPCGQFSIARTFPATGRVHFTAQGDCTIPRDTVRLPDSTALKAAQQALRDTTQVAVQLRSALKIATDSLAKWPKATPPKDSVPVPPKDTTPTPPPPPPADTTPASGSAVLFRSDWSGGLFDGGKWTRWGGKGSLAVVDAAGLGFPATMGSVLRVQHYQQDFDWVMANNKWSPPAIGSSIAFRVYLRNAVSDVVDAGTAYASTHPVESEGGPNGISGQFYAIHYGSYTDGTYPFFLGVDQATYPLNGWTPGANASTHGGRSYDPATLKKNTTYRLEWKFTRVGTNAYDLDMRIVGPDDRTVLFDKTSIYAWGGDKSQTLAASGKALPIDAAHMSDLRFGINGGFPTPSPQFVYWGGFAVCADWCGPYAAGR